ncbi:NUDIX domain-containing protein [Vagococcus sp. DIV0080]|uniref:NUDIX domain-containing protein n=1 Tax=Candidatus Vagococcus giribetii TaxID=2230876 RepID=A0ABS3HRQ9_9ENTE|nr:NUDIX domain-containing protein [Vagococcus sp. DIV0080]MBO0476459.1 NUDIX domain-containing protein [Vagococcus sp. DIV0080]
MTDIRMTIEGSRFDVRACGILRKEGKVLVSFESDGVQTLTGGAVKMGETSEEAVIREFKEETNLDVEVKELSAIIENFFDYDDRPYQQLIFVYDLVLSQKNQELICREKVNVTWAEENQLTNLKPSALNELISSKSQGIAHCINVGE